MKQRRQNWKPGKRKTPKTMTEISETTLPIVIMAIEYGKMKLKIDIKTQKNDQRQEGLYGKWNEWYKTGKSLKEIYMPLLKTGYDLPHYKDLMQNKDKDRLDIKSIREQAFKPIKKTVKISWLVMDTAITAVSYAMMKLKKELKVEKNESRREYIRGAMKSFAFATKDLKKAYIKLKREGYEMTSYEGGLQDPHYPWLAIKGLNDRKYYLD